MRYSVILWDLDGVVYHGRGTTHLAAGSSADPEKFIYRFIDECEKEGPLSDIKPLQFEFELTQWENKNKTKIDTMQKLGAAVTDLRHVHKIFTSKHTQYIKNAILEGISLKDVIEIVGGIELTPGFQEAVDGFKSDGRNQIIFSNASGPIADFFSNEYGMGHSDGLPVYVKMDNEEVLYNSQMYGNPDIVLAGRAAEGFDKLPVFKSHVEENGIEMANIAAIDDDHVEILKTIKEGDGLPIGFMVKDRYIEEMKENSIEIINENDLRIFLRKVREAERA